MESVKGLIRREKLIDFPLLEKFNGLDHMAQDEPVHIDDDGEEDAVFFRQPIGCKHMVIDLLAILHKELNPPAVPDGHDIAMIVPDTQRGREGPVRNDHDDGQSQARCDIGDLAHQRESLGTRTGK